MPPSRACMLFPFSTEFIKAGKAPAEIVGCSPEHLSRNWGAMGGKKNLSPKAAAIMPTLGMGAGRLAQDGSRARTGGGAGEALTLRSRNPGRR